MSPEAYKNGMTGRLSGMELEKMSTLHLEAAIDLGLGSLSVLTQYVIKATHDWTGYATMNPKSVTAQQELEKLERARMSGDALADYCTDKAQQKLAGAARYQEPAFQNIKSYLEGAATSWEALASSLVEPELISGFSKGEV
jgi:hypothetical protein